MTLMRIKYEGGKADGVAGGVPPNVTVIHYGNKGEEQRYDRTDRIDQKGRPIFTLTKG